MKKTGKILLVLLVLFLMTGCGGEEKKQVTEQTGGETNAESTVISGNTTEETTGGTKEEESSEAVEYSGEPAFPDGKLYVNEKYRYAVTVPKEWEELNRFPNVVSFFSDTPSDTNYVMGIFIFGNPEKLTIEEWFKANPEWPYPDRAEHPFKKTKLNEISALQDTLIGDYYFTKNDKVFRFQNGAGAGGGFTKEELDLFEKTVNSLVFIK